MCHLEVPSGKVETTRPAIFHLFNFSRLSASLAHLNFFYSETGLAQLEQA
jgi:hypothetical protein